MLQVEELSISSQPRRLVLYHPQATARSALGALALESSGMFIDHGWLRILGSGGSGLPDLAAVNHLTALLRHAAPRVYDRGVGRARRPVCDLRWGVGKKSWKGELICAGHTGVERSWYRACRVRGVGADRFLSVVLRGYAVGWLGGGGQGNGSVERGRVILATVFGRRS